VALAQENPAPARRFRERIKTLFDKWGLRASSGGRNRDDSGGFIEALSAEFRSSAHAGFQRPDRPRRQRAFA
jgi:plasmid stabilization system protein ParE